MAWNDKEIIFFFFYARLYWSTYRTTCTCHMIHQKTFRSSCKTANKCFVHFPIVINGLNSSFVISQLRPLLQGRGDELIVSIICTPSPHLNILEPTLIINQIERYVDIVLVEDSALCPPDQEILIFHICYRYVDRGNVKHHPKCLYSKIYSGIAIHDS